MASQAGQDMPTATQTGRAVADIENRFPTLLANWEHFEKVDIAPTAPPIQRHEMQRAFYAGASSGMALACFAWDSGDFPGGIAELLAELKAWKAMRNARDRRDC